MKLLVALLVAASTPAFANETSDFQMKALDCVAVDGLVIHQYAPDDVSANLGFLARWELGPAFEVNSSGKLDLLLYGPNGSYAYYLELNIDPRTAVKTELAHGTVFRDSGSNYRGHALDRGTSIQCKISINKGA